MAIIGIDLGTTTSAIGYFDERKGPRLLKDLRGDEIIDSLFGYDPQTRKPVVGKRVRNTMKSHPHLAVKEVKRLMGSDEKITVGDQTLTPAEVSARILSHLKASAEEYLAEDVDRCIITVPANFPDRARRATKEAGAIANMKVERLLNEPTAAALAYGLGETKSLETVMVYDLGGGTFDVSIVKYAETVTDVLGSSGDTALGGKDFDQSLLEYVRNDFKRQTGAIIEDESSSYYRLLYACEDAKKELSFETETTIDIPFLLMHNGKPASLNTRVTRNRLESLIAPQIDRTTVAMEKALTDAGIDKSDIDRVVLVGGSSRIPYVRSVVEQFMEMDASRDIDPDKAVALGAAKATALVDGTSDDIIRDVCPLSLGTTIVDTSGGRRTPGVYAEIIPTNGKLNVQYTKSYRPETPEQTSIGFTVYQRDSTSTATQAESDGVPNRDAGFSLITRERIDLPRGTMKEKSFEATYVYNENGIIDITIEFGNGYTYEFAAYRELDQEELNEARTRLRDDWVDFSFPEHLEPVIRQVDTYLDDDDTPVETRNQLQNLRGEIVRALNAKETEKVEALKGEIVGTLFDAGY